MLIQPELIIEHWWLILMISAITIVGKFISTLIDGFCRDKTCAPPFRPEHLAQIGEFSFIIATLGMELKVTSPFLYPIAIAVSVITSFLTPYLIVWSEPVYQWLSGKIPPTFEKSLNSYSMTLFDKRSSTNFVSIFWEMYGLKIVLNATLIISIALFISKFVLVELKKYTVHTMRLELVVLLVTL